MTDRKLASIREITDIQPIDGADAIEVAAVGGWKVVTKKGEYKSGELCIYCEVDSFLPIRGEFEFLRKSSYKKLKDGSEGFRLKTIRLRGQISQGLIISLNELLKYGVSADDVFEGMDVTDMLGITKYDPSIPTELSGTMKGGFPSYIPKTDEERVQNLTKEYKNWLAQDLNFYVTEKLDGSSATFYLNDGVFGVCSRNIDLLETEGNTFWKVARELNIEEKLRGYGRNLALQGELIGEGIQGNPYQIKGQTVRFYNVYDIDAQLYYGLPMFIATITIGLKLETVPILTNLTMKLPESIDAVLKYAEGMSVLNPNFDREGVVFRTMDRIISFKCISNKFLLNEK